MNVRALMKRGVQLLLDTLYPERVLCLCCRDRSGGELLCDDCRKRLDKLRLKDNRLDASALQNEAADVRAVWRYRHEASQLVRQLKLHCVRNAAEVMAQAMAEEAARMELPPDTVVTSVAMPQRRIRQRGIDHGRMLAEMVAAQLGMPYRPLLMRSPGGHTQRGLNRRRRLANLQGRFTANPLSGEHVLLVDDVLTTGATAAVCTRVLLDAGAGSVRVIAAAHVIREESADV